jgi:hypothetical protein
VVCAPESVVQHRLQAVAQAAKAGCNSTGCTRVLFTGHGALAVVGWTWHVAILGKRGKGVTDRIKPRGFDSWDLLPHNAVLIPYM